MKTVFLGIFIWLLSQSALAHPTSFQGGTAFLFSSSKSETSWQLHYSYKYWGALGVEKLNWRDATNAHLTEVEIARANFLLHRFHQQNSQANIYLNFGAGQERHRGDSQSLQLFESQVDWESREVYTMASYTRWYRDRANDIETTKVRVGFAPYLGDFKDLSTWLIFEASQKTGSAKELTTFFRFYFRNVLWEIGGTQTGDTKLNLMIHY